MFIEMDLAIDSKLSLFTFIPNLRASVHQKLSSQWALFSSRNLNTTADFLVNRSASNLSFHEIHVISFTSETALVEGIKGDEFINEEYLSNKRLDTRGSNSKTGTDDCNRSFSK